MDEKKFNKLVPYLQEVLKSQITLNGDDEKAYNKKLDDVLKQNLIPKMKDIDPVFKELYRKEMYTGSYYENLRVGTPDEFDLNLVLKLPAESFILEECQPGFLKIKTTDWRKKDVLQKVLSWRDSKGYIQRDHVLRWLQSVVDQAMRELGIPECNVRRSMHGPAVTATVSFGRQQFSVDLVPVFVFGRDKWPKCPVRPPPTDYHSEDWCIVPKGPHNNPLDKRFWRMSFYAQEKNILKHLYTVKPVLKLIKLLRDKEGWHNLVSYHIKTVFMWAYSEDSSLGTKSLGVVFMHMLEKLKQHMRTRKIPFYWDKRCNMISNMKSIVCENIANRIEALQKSLIRNVDSEPQWVKTLFIEQPAAKQPVVKQPAAEQPASKQAAVKQSVAKQPTVKEPAAKQLAVMQPAAKQPTVKQPTAMEPTAKQCAAKESMTNKPALKQAAANQPTTKQPTVMQSAAKQPTATKATAKQPTATKSTAKQPTAKQPATKQPTAKQPATKQLSLKQPAAKQPSLKQPAAKKPAVKQPAAKQSALVF